MIGKNDSIGPAEVPKIGSNQPHWNPATTTPNAAQIDKRFIAAALIGIKILLKRIIRRSMLRITTVRMKLSSLEVRTSPKSLKVATMPPTWILTGDESVHH
jgi:hypothetical protein